MDAAIKKELIRDIEDTQVILRTDLEIEPLQDAEDESGNLGERKLYELSTEQIERLRAEVFEHFNAIKDSPQRKEAEKRWDALDAQYAGEMISDNASMEFNLNVPVTQDKVDAFDRMAVKAFLESDPKFDIKLRPEAIRQGMNDAQVSQIERAQLEYLDYQLDERINIASPLRLTIHQASKLDGGVMKIPYVYLRKRKVRDEYYSGKRTMDDSGAESPEGMRSFLLNYPKAMLPGEEGHEQFKKLMMFEDVKFQATFWDTVYDDAKPMHVDCRDFYVRPSCEGYDGLCNEQFYAERTRYTYWDLKKEEAAGNIINADDVKYTTGERQDTKTDPQYHIKEHNILECTYWFKMNSDDDEETKIICLFNEENKAFHGAFDYPYDNVEAIYVPYYVKAKKKGWYKGGLAQDLTDSHLAQNAILNLTLSEAFNQIVTTPIVRNGSQVANQLLSGRWKQGIPLIIGPEESRAESIDFMPKTNSRSAMELLNLLMFLGRYDDRRTGISGLASGQETPLDPNAPAAKTAMLMRQSGVSIEDYINCLLPSFNKTAEIILKLTHQAADSGCRYRQRQKAGRVAGGELFGKISRDDLMMDTVIQSRASGFAFDRVSEKQENMTIYQLLRQEPLIATNPKAVHNLVHSLLESWSPMWRAKADQIAMDVGEMDAAVAKVGLRSLGVYLQGLQQQAKTTGAMPQPDVKAYLQMTAEMMSQMVNGQPEEKDGAQ